MENLRQSKESTADLVSKALKGLLNDLKDAGKNDEILQVQDEIADYVDRVEEKYPHYARLLPAFHALIGSTLPPGVKVADETDFPGEDSILVFLKNLRTKLLGSQNPV